MSGCPSIASVLHMLGYEAAKKVLAIFPDDERESMAVEAAGEIPSDVEMDRAAAFMSLHVQVARLVDGLGRDEAGKRLRSRMSAAEADELLRRVCFASPVDEAPARPMERPRLDELPLSTLARVLAFLPDEHAGRILLRMAGDIVDIAMACEAAGLLDRLGAALSELDQVDRDEMLDSVAEVDPELATKLQMVVGGMISLLELDYDELLAMLGGKPVEDIAAALVAAETAGEAAGPRPPGGALF